ncbi:MAG: hypothetical protein CL678_14855 [Bdellovibrionaceae bacterium]|nr:hypothetical protein [Pseudobdellovibrionaceae bacterium]|tara:strand:- start:6856 stop:7692 length:837 start_codon:yes stop_codon:yes gene_type:complete
MLNQLKNLKSREDAFGVKISIGGSRIGIKTNSKSLYFQVQSFYSSYLSDGDLDAEIFIQDISFEKFENIQIESRSKTQDGFSQGENWSALSLNSRKAVAYLVPEKLFAMHELMKWFIPYALIHQNSVLLSGSAIADHGKGIGFIGKAGEGRSTSLALFSSYFPNAQVIADGFWVLEKELHLVMHSLPFGKDYHLLPQSRLTYPVRELFVLNSNHDQVKEVNFSDVLFSNIEGLDYGELLDLKKKWVEKITKKKTTIKIFSPDYFSNLSDFERSETAVM